MEINIPEKRALDVKIDVAESSGKECKRIIFREGALRHPPSLPMNIK